MEKQVSDKELLELWKEGKTKAFDLLYERHVLQLAKVAFVRLGDRELAEELVQETFISFYHKKQTIACEDSVFALLYVILKNKVYDLQRHSTVRQKFQQHLNHSYSELDNSTTEVIEYKQLEERLASEIEKLSPQCRAVFKLSRMEDLSNKQIAKTLSISENTVEQHMRKALRILRGSMFDYMRIAALGFLTGYFQV